MIIYIVTNGTYSDYHVVAAYSTLDEAETLKKQIASGNNILELELDKPFALPPGLLFYHVKINKYGDVSYVMQENAMDANCTPGTESWYSARDNEHLVFKIWARDEHQAVKAANEYRAQAVALNAWDHRLVNI